MPLSATAQMELVLAGVADDLGRDSQYASVAAGVAHRVRRIDDEVLQHQAQYGPRDMYGADAAQ